MKQIPIYAEAIAWGEYHNIKNKEQLSAVSQRAIERGMQYGLCLVVKENMTCNCSTELTNQLDISTSQDLYYSTSGGFIPESGSEIITPLNWTC